MADLPEPTIVNGFEQQPIHGVSMAYSSTTPDAADRRETQYFEMVCNRGIYHKGWTAVTRHSVPWLFGAELPAFDDDVWELYDTTTDWTQAHDLAAEHPDRLADAPAALPHRGGEVRRAPARRPPHRALQLRAGREAALAKGPSQLFFGGMGRVTENTVLNLKNKSYSVTADIDVPAGGASGVIVAQGGAFAGWSLYLHDGVPTHCYNLLGLNRVKAAGTEPLAPGNHQLRVEFTYDGGGLAKGATPTCSSTAPGRDGPPGGEYPDALLRRRDPRPRSRFRHVGQ